MVFVAHLVKMAVWAKGQGGGGVFTPVSKKEQNVKIDLTARAK
jgi:hypothetical protein